MGVSLQAAIEVYANFASSDAEAYAHIEAEQKEKVSADDTPRKIAEMQPSPRVDEMRHGYLP